MSGKTLSLFDEPAATIQAEIDADIARLSRYAPGDISAARHGGAEASERAHEQTRQRIAEMRERVYQFIYRRGEYGATTDEIAEAWNLFPNQLSGRVSELLYREKPPRVVKSGAFRKTRNGVSASVIVAKEWA